MINLYTNAPQIVNALKTKPRSGWKYRGVPEDLCENIWEHQEKVGFAARAYSKNRAYLDGNRMTDMGFVHDIAEFDSHDYRPGEISEEQKRSIELAIVSKLPDIMGPMGIYIMDLWMEFEKRETPESQILRQLDKMDPAMQAMIYEAMGYPTQDFYPDVRPRISDPALLRVFDQMMKHTWPVEETYVHYFRLLEIV